MLTRNKRASIGLSIFVVLFFVAVCILWVFSGFNPLLQPNIGSFIAPVVFSQLFQIIIGYDFRSSIFATFIGIVTLIAFIFIANGWDWIVFTAGIIGNMILLVGMLLDERKNVEQISGYTFFFMIISMTVSILIVVLAAF